MNRDINGETPRSLSASSSNYLVYLFLISAALIVVLPYTFQGRGILTRSKTSETGKSYISSSSSSNSRKSVPPSYAPLYASNDVAMRRIYASESKCDALEVLVVDLQKVVHTDREKTLHLENEIRVLQISESFLKERVQYLEERSWESRKEPSSTSPSLELLLRSAPTDGKQHVDTIVHELLRIVQSEKDRTTALEMEVIIMQKSESILIERIQKLEDQFAATCKTSANECEAKAQVASS